MALLTITTHGLRPLPLSLLSQSLPMLSRHELEDVVERLIDELDRRDGDPDLEPEEDCCAAGDDGCGPVKQQGHVLWGSAWDDQGVITPPLRARPVARAGERTSLADNSRPPSAARQPAQCWLPLIGAGELT